MAYVFPGALLPWIDRRFTDALGVPLANGSIASFIAGTSTPLETYADSNLNTANAVVITLNANGCAPNPMFLLPRAYKFIVYDSQGVVQPHYPFDSIQDDGQIFAEYFGTFFFAGSKDVISGYTTLNSDHLVTVSSTGGPDPCIVNLISAALAVWPLTIKNVGDTVLSVVPNGANTIDGGVVAVAIAAGGALTFVSDGVSAWTITSGYVAP